MVRFVEAQCNEAPIEGNSRMAVEPRRPWSGILPVDDGLDDMTTEISHLQTVSLGTDLNG